VQVKVGGGHGGNNGVKSVSAHLGTAEYVRVRVGIGRPSHPSESASYVLGRFTRAHDRALEECLDVAADAALAVAELGAVQAMNQFNRRKPA
jgi:PTH1 family peptidyl-tRNA hydrolase